MTVRGLPPRSPPDVPELEDDAWLIPLDVLERIRRLFEFLRRLEQQRSPVRRDLESVEWSLHLSDVPDHEAVRRGDGRTLLAVRRPELSGCPPPPATLEAWLIPGWDDPEATAVVRDSRTLPGKKLERLREDPKRAKEVRAWLSRRTRWAEAERAARDAAELFDRLLALWARLQREGDRLRVLMGDGHLVWDREDAPVRHPLLLQEVELRFDETERELVLLAGSAPPFLYAELLASFVDVDGEKRKACRATVDEAVDRGALASLEGKQPERVLRALAELLAPPTAASEPGPGAGSPRLERDPVLFCVPRTTGFAAVYEGFLQRLNQLPALPKGLALVVGDVDAKTPPTEEPDADLFFTKPANDAQARIARRLEATGAVLVQGPPGTGKTHTIANLVGHFLAEGKTVLVTAQTSKALRVVRSHVVETLAPLCVSVLDSDVESREQLESSVNAIVTQLSVPAAEYEREAAVHEARRRALQAQRLQTERALLEALEAELRALDVGGTTVTPAEAGRRLGRGAGTDDWLPGPLVKPGRLPLTMGELETLYRLNAQLTAADEREVKTGAPAPTELPPIGVVEHLALAKEDPLAPVPASWPERFRRAPLGELEALAKRVRELLQRPGELPEWGWTCIQAALLGGAHLEPWSELLERMENAAGEIAELQKSLLRFEVRYPPSLSTDETVTTVRELLTHLASGGGLGWLALAGKGTWRRLLEQTTVNGRRPESELEVRALDAALTIEWLRRDIARRWDALLGRAGLPWSGQGDTAHIEEVALAQAPELRRALGWADVLLPGCVEALVALGLPWEDLLEEIPARPPFAQLRRTLQCLEDAVLPALEREIERHRRFRLQSELALEREKLSRYTQSSAALEAVAAIDALDVERYRAACANVERLWSLRTSTALREKLLETLWRFAPTWAERIRARLPPHQGPELPGDVQAAWQFRALSDALDARKAGDVDALQQALGALQDSLEQVTGRLVENRAWAAQARRTDVEQRRALMSWLDVVKRLGKGHSKRAQEYRASARQKLKVARSAVPVWIMPLSRVAESFGPDQPLFDVVILDEASQCDVSALVAFGLGKRIVVVGDDEQVSPSAIGEGVEDVRELQREWLDGFPDQELFDGRASAYEIARRAFPGGLIRLNEHFRCVPEIISFSNALCYDGQIRPLREASSARVFPALVGHRVPHGLRSAGGKVNRVEALEVASLVVAATREPLYQGLELGVISLLGAEQAKDIDLLLQRYLDPATYKERRLVCGTAAHFQGDERDVMFLSLVDSGGDGRPLRLLDRDEMRQRYNVAVSRARDQLWVVHSLSPESDLKADDLRRKLLEHTKGPPPRGEGRGEKGKLELTPPLETLQHALKTRLQSAGYQVEVSHHVGLYEVPLVVTGGQSRLGILCDGDPSAATLPAQLEQQGVLGRLGWRFIRVKASAYFRNPDRTLTWLKSRLAEQGITATLQPSGAPPVRDATAQILQRAAALRRQWLDNAGSFEALFASPGKARKAVLQGETTTPDPSVNTTQKVTA